MNELLPDGAREIIVREETLRLLPEGALYWPKESLLVVADLHLGKAETFGRHGLPLPGSAAEIDLVRIETAARREGAKSLLLLGDLVHTRDGLTPELIARFRSTADQFEGGATLVAGNHDRGLVKRWPAEWAAISIVDEFTRGPFLFRHEPAESAARNTTDEKSKDPFVWSGHLHPCVVLRGGGDRLRLKTFVIREREGILPAFSGLAGGFDIEPDRNTRFYPLAEDRVFSL